MALKDKILRGKRWINIGLSQFKLFCEKNKRPCSEARDKVIVIKIDAIGDFLIWTNSASEYREIYKGKKITLLCNKMCEDIAKNCGYFDEIITIDSRRFESDNKYKRKILSSLGEQEYEILLQPAYSRTIDMDLLALNIRAHKKIAFRADESRDNLSRYITLKFIKNKIDKSYDELIQTTDENIMELRRNADFVRGLGRAFRANYPSLPLAQIQNTLIPEKPYFVIFPGSSSKKKMWPIENFAAVSEYLMNKKGWGCCVCGSKSEEYLYYGLVDSIKEERLRKLVVNYCGKTSLVELAELIRNASILLSNDTSGIHFAAAVNTPGICLLGEFAYGRFLPYDLEMDSNGHNGIYVCSAGMQCRNCATGKMTSECKAHLLKTGKYLCIDKISVEQVIGKVGEVINEV